MVVVFWAVSIVGLLSPSPQDQTATWLAVRGVLTLAHSAANTKHIVCQQEIRNASALRLFAGIALGYGMPSIATASKADAYNLSQPLQSATSSPCTTCGACCSYSAEWPRFSTEDDEALARIPEALVAENLSGMRCDGERCMALARQNWRGDALHHLCGPAPSVPRLSARRRGVPDGARALWLSADRGLRGATPRAACRR